MKISLSLLFIAIFSGCVTKAKTDADSYLEVFEKGTDSTFAKSVDENSRLTSMRTKYRGAQYETKYKYVNNSLVAIEGFFLGKQYGHHFLFNNKGNLKTYYYLYGDGIKNSYLLEYSDDGKLVHKEGHGFVDYFLVNSDSVDVYFSKVFIDSISAFSSFKDNIEKSISLKQSPMQPMLLEGRTAIKDSILFLRTFVIDNFNRRGISYYDTLLLY